MGGSPHSRRLAESGSASYSAGPHSPVFHYLPSLPPPGTDGPPKSQPELAHGLVLMGQEHDVDIVLREISRRLIGRLPRERAKRPLAPTSPEQVPPPHPRSTLAAPSPHPRRTCATPSLHPRRTPATLALQAAVWTATAEFLSARLQSSTKEMEGVVGFEQRTPDMSEAAAAAFRAVLSEVAAEEVASFFKRAVTPLAVPAAAVRPAAQVGP